MGSLPASNPRPNPRQNTRPNGDCWRLNALWARFRAVECLHPLGLLPEDAGAVELDDEAGEEGDQDKPNQIPDRIDGRSVAVFSHAGEVRTGANWLQPGESRYLLKINFSGPETIGGYLTERNADPRPRAYPALGLMLHD